MSNGYGNYGNYGRGRHNANDGIVDLVVVVILLAIACPIVAIYWIINGTEEKKMIGWIIMVLMIVVGLCGGV